MRENDMKITKTRKNVSVLILIAVLLFSFPATAVAQDTTPPEVEEERTFSDDDILVFEPEFHLEFPFAQGFEISFNFGLSIEVPRRLMLVDNEVLNFFLRFRSYVIPAEGPVSPLPTVTPTPEGTSGD